MFKEQWKNCTNCTLSEVRTQVVFGTGNENARLVFIGEAPGRDEDINGVPFVGQAGQMFDKILNAVGIDRNEIWITNTCLCRPKIDEVGRKNRAPNAKEIKACQSRLQEEMIIISPQIVVLAGNTPLYMATGKRGITKHRGWVTSGDKKVYATLHPASLMYGSAEQIKQKKRCVWEDWQEIAREYEKISS